MKPKICLLAWAHALLTAVALSSGAAHATSSSTVWTPMSPDIQAYGVFHLGVDNYFAVLRNDTDGAGDFPTDIGLTVGILPFQKFQMEVGVDLLEPSDEPLVLNAKVGRISVAPYTGNSRLLVDASGEKENDGFMVAFDRGFLPVRDAVGNAFDRLVLAADYASGDNAVGGTGLALSFAFASNIRLLTGPVWFHEEVINGKWKWTVQLDIDLPALSRRRR